MYCSKCGKEIDDDAVVCVHCGASVEKKEEKPQSELSKITSDYDADRKTLGIITSLFFNLIPLIVGYFIFPEGTNARKTFTKGCVIGLLINVAIIIVGVIIDVVATAAVIY